MNKLFTAGVLSLMTGAELVARAASGPSGNTPSGISLAGLTNGSTFTAQAADGFVDLFNGRDLTGWVNANCAPETWSVHDGMIHCAGRPFGVLRTSRQYENFILEAEWRLLSYGGNSGIFIWGTPLAAPGAPHLRGIEVQVLDHGYTNLYQKKTGKKADWFTTHGDVFPIHGATMKPFGRSDGMRSFPSEQRSKGSPEWNHYLIICTNGVLRLHVNGKEVSGGEECNYRKGYLGLEAEGAPVEFRNLRIKELPNSGASAELTAPLDPGWRALFTGLDLRGWKTNEATGMGWQVSGERMLCKEGLATNPQSILWTDTRFGDAELMLDCWTAKPVEGKELGTPIVIWHGVEAKLEGATPGSYSRFTITSKGREITLKRNDILIQNFTVGADTSTTDAIGLRATGGAVEFMNLYIRDL